VTFRDVTSRIEAEERVRQRDLELSHMARLSTTGEMASALAHELNQPFFAIMNFVGGAIRRADAGRLDADTLRDVLETPRASRTRRPHHPHGAQLHPEKRLSPETVDIRTIVEESPLHRDRGAAKRVALPLLREPAMVDCDWVLIEQVISNLARNGIEAMIDTPIERRQLTLSTHLTAAGSVNVSIEDRGHGLPAPTRTACSTPSSPPRKKAWDRTVPVPLDRRFPRRPPVGHRRRQRRRKIPLQPATDNRRARP
jgi:two-component system sensor kinase FixL